MRENYRDKEFSSWAEQTIHGHGVETYKETAISHDWISNRPAEIPVSTYLAMIRARINWLPVRANPGCTSAREKRCRHCLLASDNAPWETLDHIWGNCPKVHGMRVDRHDAIVKLIAEKCKKNESWEVQIEPRDNRNFKPDIVIKARDKFRAWIIDPTIRTEVTIDDIGAINQEKETKYEPTVEQLRQVGFQTVTVKGLWIGARGVISSEGKGLLESHGFVKKDFYEIICTVLKLSHSMYRVFLQ